LFNCPTIIRTTTQAVSTWAERGQIGISTARVNSPRRFLLIGT
jgi:hypothetical protein